MYILLQPYFDNDGWHHFVLFYDGISENAEITITELHSGSLIYSREFLPFVLDDFSYIAMGYYDQPNYGHAWCPIRIDNIIVRAWSGRPDSSAGTYQFSNPYKRL